MELDPVNANSDRFQPLESLVQLPFQAQTAEVQLAAVVENMAEAFFALDLAGHCTYLNSKAERLLGSDRTHLIGKTLWDVFQAGPPSRLYQQCHQVIIKKVPVEFEEFYASFERWFAVRLLAVPGGLAAYFQDITERKETEAALREKQIKNALHQSEAQLASIFQTIPDGILILNQQGQITAANAVAEQILRLTRSNITGRAYNDPSWAITTVDGKQFPEEELPFAQVMRTRKPIYGVEHAIAQADGTTTVLSINASPLFDAEGGITHVIAAISDITEHKQVDEERVRLIQEQMARTLAEAAQRRSAFLAKVSETLASSLDYEQTLQSVTQLAVPYFADWCAVDLLNDDSTISRVAVAHSDPAKVELGWEVAQRFPRHLEDGYGISQVMKTGQSDITIALTDEQLTAAVSNLEYLEILRKLGLKSCIVAPLQANGRVLGSISFVFAESNRHYGTNDLELAEDLARRAAIAIDNAHLYYTAQQAKQAAETFANRKARLQTVTAALSESLTPAQVAEVIVEQSIAALEADAALMALVNKAGTALEIVRMVGYPTSSAAAAQQPISLNAAFPLAEAVRTGQPIWSEPLSERLVRYPHLADIYKSLPFQAWISLPLIVEGKSVGGLSLSFRQFKRLSQDDCEFMLALSRQCAQAIFRAQLYEAERKARAEAEQANRVKDEFLAVLSHELRSPLNPILGWTRILRTQQLQPEKVDQALATVERNAKLQAQLIEDLLDISRTLQGKLSLDIAPVNLKTVIQGAIETVQLAASAKSIQIKTQLQESLGLVLGDANRLQQVLWNLLSNAVKFTPNQGQITIQLEESDRQVQIQVIDNGTGIHPDFLPHVFEYFRQADSSTTRQFGGLGLGLAIAHQIMELHGGTLRAESPGEGLGATFTVCLPLTTVGLENTTVPNPPAPFVDLTGLQVLVVDDEVDMRHLAEFMLEQQGARVTAVGSAAEAMAAISQSIPDVLLCDIGMPEMSGYALMQHIRGRSPEEGGMIPAIALTAYAGEYDRHQAIAAGFQRHISKPVEPEELIKAIAQVANSDIHQ